MTTVVHAGPYTLHVPRQHPLANVTLLSCTVHCRGSIHLFMLTFVTGEDDLCCLMLQTKSSPLPAVDDDKAVAGRGRLLTAVSAPEQHVPSTSAPPEPSGPNPDTEEDAPDVTGVPRI